jgi:hypothetical protein
MCDYTRLADTLQGSWNGWDGGNSWIAGMVNYKTIPTIFTIQQFEPFQLSDNTTIQLRMFA